MTENFSLQLIYELNEKFKMPMQCTTPTIDQYI